MRLPGATSFTAWGGPSNAALLALLAGLFAACRASTDCAELGSVSGLAVDAALLRLELYPSSARCAGNGVDRAGTSPLQVLDYVPHTAAALDLPPGVFVVHLVAYRDAAATEVIGEGCSATGVYSRETTCLALALGPVADAGSADASAADAAPVDAAAADAASGDSGCTPVTHSNGVGQNYVDCAPIGQLDVRLAREACAASTGSAAVCETNGCSGGAGGGDAICDKENPCTCWTYSGPGAGYVRQSARGGGCDCGQPGDPAWN